MKKILVLFALAFSMIVGASQVNAAVIYNSINNPLPGSYPSQGYEATSVSGLGDHIIFSGTERNLTTVKVTMTNWSCENDFDFIEGAWVSKRLGTEACVTTPGSGFNHPITLNIYAVDHSGVNPAVGALIATKSINAFIPFRPSYDPTSTCTAPGGDIPFGGTWYSVADGKCYHGFNTNINFDFTADNITLPNEVIYEVAYNTADYGANPIHAAGPYNSLNYGLSSAALIGTDVEPDTVFMNSSWGGAYCDSLAGVGTFRMDTGCSPSNNWTGYVPTAEFNANTPVLSCDQQISTSNIYSDGTETNNTANPTVATWVHPGWLNISGATWIWNSFHVLDPLNGETITFNKTINVPGTPTSASITIAADNTYEASLNGTPFGSSADLDNFSSGNQDTYPLTLQHGDNTLTITAQNAPWDTDNPEVNPGGLLYALNLTQNACVPTPPVTSVKVTIEKFVNGVKATAENTNGVSFPMHAIYPGGAGDYELSSAGFNNNPTPYQAITGDMPVGSDYSTYETIPTECTGTNPFALEGYSTGSTLQAAEAGQKSLTVPNFTNLQGDQFVVVWNKSCAVIPPIKVHILKYLDGVKADSISANGYQFPMVATWMTANLNGGVSSSGNYFLGNNHGGAVDQYGADTSPMSVPADYTTSEITNSSSQVVSTIDQCVPGKYLLNGYKTSSVSFADAAAQSLTTVAPVFTALNSDQYVIVSNSKCPTTSTISGTKYNDLNRNGRRDAGEPGLAGWVIRLKNGNVTLTTVTDWNGDYSFLNLLPGTYKVRETHKNGWKRMSKNPRPIVITVAGTSVTNVNFGNAQKHKEEKDDNDKDDERDDQVGNYYPDKDKDVHQNDNRDEHNESH